MAFLAKGHRGFDWQAIRHRPTGARKIPLGYFPVGAI
jgi:hypothetical protein